jgi:hypothetical protein
VAPGTGIRSTDRFGFDATGLAGTSFAAPHVAGALALLLQMNPRLTASEQAALLAQSAGDLGAPGPDFTFGAGSLDIAAAARVLSPALDVIPPVLSAAGVAAGQIHVHAVDGSSAIAGGESWTEGDPGAGAGQPMTAADGRFDSASEDLVAPIGGLAPGVHSVGFRARDAAGNWSPAETIAFTVPAPPAAPPSSSPAPPPASTTPPAQPVAASALRLTLTDGFEAGLGSWRRAGDVRALRSAAISGRRGLRIHSSAGARSFAQRRLSRPTARLELGFSLRAGAISSPGWSGLATIDAADGSQLAALELETASRSVVRLRLSLSGAAGTSVHSRPVVISRRSTRIVFALDPVRAVLSLDGRARATEPSNAGPPAAAVTFGGALKAALAQTTGYLDIDDVAARSAPD